MQLVYVIGHCEEQDLRKNFLASPKQKASEAVILLNHPKSALGLDGAVHTEQDTLLTRNTIQRSQPLLDEFLGNVDRDRGKLCVIDGV